MDTITLQEQLKLLQKYRESQEIVANLDKAVCVLRSAKSLMSTDVMALELARLVLDDYGRQVRDLHQRRMKG